jgi:hypothetical protein
VGSSTTWVGRLLDRCDAATDLGRDGTDLLQHDQDVGAQPVLSDLPGFDSQDVDAGVLDL